MGGSNGDCSLSSVTQRPSLQSMYSRGGVMDMLRYHKFSPSAGTGLMGTSADLEGDVRVYLKASFPPITSDQVLIILPHLLLLRTMMTVLYLHTPSNLQLLCTLDTQEKHTNAHPYWHQQDTEVGNLCRNSWSEQADIYGFFILYNMLKYWQTSSSNTLKEKRNANHTRHQKQR